MERRMNDEFPTYVGNNKVIESGVAVLGEDDDWLTVRIRGLNFSIGTVNEPKLPPISNEHPSRDSLRIRINTWQGGDLTFKFKVGTYLNADLYLAVNLAIHYNHRIITYTFSRRGS
jgi:hypothetical protein